MKRMPTLTIRGAVSFHRQLIINPRKISVDMTVDSLSQFKMFRYVWNIIWSQFKMFSVYDVYISIVYALIRKKKMENGLSRANLEATPMDIWYPLSIALVTCVLHYSNSRKWQCAQLQSVVISACICMDVIQHAMSTTMDTFVNIFIEFTR